jgi:oligoribonuclease NrnB/cAMP/cGMP phosphodiesterase (DHH superfamily)
MQLFFEAGIIEGTFDLERSGAGIAWDELHGADTRPDLINYIEDRDLWRFKYGEDTKTFHAFISSHPYDFGLWKQLMDETNMDLVFEQGGAIRRKHKKDVDEIIDQCLQWQTIQGHRVPVINIPYTHGSEAAAEMLRRYPDAPFAAYYCDAEGERRWGFRSQDHRVDVSEIAKNWGGGGHRNASGVIVPFVEPKVV